MAPKSYNLAHPGGALEQDLHNHQYQHDYAGLVRQLKGLGGGDGSNLRSDGSWPAVGRARHLQHHFCALTQLYKASGFGPAWGEPTEAEFARINVDIGRLLAKAATENADGRAHLAIRLLHLRTRNIVGAQLDEEEDEGGLSNQLESLKPAPGSDSDDDNDDNLALVYQVLPYYGFAAWPSMRLAALGRWRARQATTAGVFPSEKAALVLAEALLLVAASAAAELPGGGAVVAELQSKSGDYASALEAADCFVRLPATQRVMDTWMSALVFGTRAAGNGFLGPVGQQPGLTKLPPPPPKRRPTTRKSASSDEVDEEEQGQATRGPPPAARHRHSRRSFEEGEDEDEAAGGTGAASSEGADDEEEERLDVEVPTDLLGKEELEPEDINRILCACFTGVPRTLQGIHSWPTQPNCTPINNGPVAEADGRMLLVVPHMLTANLSQSASMQLMPAQNNYLRHTCGDDYVVFHPGGAGGGDGDGDDVQPELGVGRYRWVAIVPFSTVRDFALGTGYMLSFDTIRQRSPHLVHDLSTDDGKRTAAAHVRATALPFPSADKAAASMRLLAEFTARQTCALELTRAGAPLWGAGAGTDKEDRALWQDHMATAAAAAATSTAAAPAAGPTGLVRAAFGNYGQLALRNTTDKHAVYLWSCGRRTFLHKHRVDLPSSSFLQKKDLSLTVESIVRARKWSKGMKLPAMMSLRMERTAGQFVAYLKKAPYDLNDNDAEQLLVLAGGPEKGAKRIWEALSKALKAYGQEP